MTGATSGIGRAAARGFAARGDRLVLAARSPAALAAVRGSAVRRRAQVLRRCPPTSPPTGALDGARRRGGRPVRRHRRWVHTAAVMAYGRFEETPARGLRAGGPHRPARRRRVARVALRSFAAAGGGTLILTGSVLGHITAPYMSGYVTSKWGLQGLARTVQQETRETPGVHVCIVTPGSVDTPVYQRAANYLGRAGRPPPPSPPRSGWPGHRGLRRPAPPGGVGGPGQPGHAVSVSPCCPASTTSSSGR